MNSLLSDTGRTVKFFLIDNLESDTDTLNIAKEFIEKFVRQREGGKNLATDQLLNVIFMLTQKKSPSEQDQKNLLECLLQSLDRR
ncbi:MAG: hypothetical protein MGG37_09795 [Trichodesmium sp. MAG_R01]|nr:hypothetical protein [Trichodesmium sp. MAG_R01]